MFVWECGARAGAGGGSAAVAGFLRWTSSDECVRVSHRYLHFSEDATEAFQEVYISDGQKPRDHFMMRELSMC